MSSLLSPFVLIAFLLKQVLNGAGFGCRLFFEGFGEDVRGGVDLAHQGFELLIRKPLNFCTDDKFLLGAFIGRALLPNALILAPDQFLDGGAAGNLF